MLRSPDLNDDSQYALKTVKYYNSIQLFSVKMLNCNLFLYFQHHYSSLQCHMIFRNHNNILIYAQDTFLIIINVEHSRAAQYFYGNRDILDFSGFFNE